MYESAKLLRGVIRASFVPQGILISCRTGRLKFSPTSRIYFRQYLAFKLSEAVRHMISSFSFKHNAIKVKKLPDMASCSLICKLRPRLKHFACLPELKLHNLCRQTQKKPKNTVYLSTFTSLLSYISVMQTLLLCVQMFCWFSDSSTQMYCLMVML